MPIAMQTMQQSMKQKLPMISLALSAIEAIVIWGSVGVDARWKEYAPLMSILADYAWLLCGLGAIGLAIASIAVDSPRKIAPVALGVSLIFFFFCGFPMIS